MTTKTNARLAGITFLVYIAAGMTSMAFHGRPHATEMLSLLSSFSALVLGVTLYALTRRQDSDLALLALAALELKCTAMSQGSLDDASATAHARPMPPEAPVTIATGRGGGLGEGEGFMNRIIANERTGCHTIERHNTTTQDRTKQRFSIVHLPISICHFVSELRVYCPMENEKWQMDNGKCFLRWI